MVFYRRALVTRYGVGGGRAPPPRLLYTREELREIRKLQAVAQVEREEVSPLRWTAGSGRGGERQ